MRKYVFALCSVIFALILFVGISESATDWSKFESGRNNIRLDGYQSQPGYISFTDGDGNVIGYVFVSDNGKLYWQGKTAGDTTLEGIDLSTTELGTVGGEIPLW